MNDNLVKKPKKEEEEIIDDEDDVELDEDSHSSDSAAKKKMMRFMLFIVCGALLLLIILYAISLMSSRSYTYEDVETILKEAAQSYFVDHPESLPKEEGNIVEIDSSNLVVAGKMKNISEYMNDAMCTGSVQVELSGTEYLYTPYLNCGEVYSTVELATKVLNGSTVSSGYGLYSTNTGYAFRGEDVNNYVKLDNSLWRIVKITSANNLVLISAEGAPYTQYWDNRYNEDRLYDAGINQYDASRIKEYLNKIYTNPDEDNGEVLLSNSDKAKMVPFNVCTGKRSIKSESKNNTEECAKYLQNQKMGLLTLSDYLYASIDPNCKSASSKSCKNYNYLTMKEDWWLVTANKEDTSTVFLVSSNGNVVAEDAGHYGIVRPVIYLNSRVLYKDGNGSAEKPYTVR